MTQLQRLQLDNGATVYIEAQPQANPPQELTRETLGKREKAFDGLAFTEFAPTPEDTVTAPQDAADNPPTMKDTIRHYTEYVLASIKEVAGANITTVKLEFGIELAGEAGIPYVTKGTAKSNVKITVECQLPGHD